LDLQGSRVSSDGGLILVRKMAERLSFGELIEQHLSNPLCGKNTQFPLTYLLRQSIYSSLAGCDDFNDAAPQPRFLLVLGRLGKDPGARR